ncbi:MAG: carbon-nitrogen hydrolase [Deltaproteobacteria bacterium]|nr:carbon-nitrogen hydrolase [Deltaproteobacteria bacterium]
MPKRNKVSVGLIQMACTEDSEGNLKKIVDRIQTASSRGVHVICLQELFRTGYFCQEEKKEYLRLAESIPGPTLELLSPLAKRNQIVIVASIFEKDEERYFNTAVVIDADGRFLGKYRKVHIPDDLKNYYGESYYFQKGDLGYPIFKTSYGTVGLQVCYDQWFPEGARALAQAGAEIIFYPTAIGYNNTPNEIERDAWITVQRGHAISNGVFVAACNRVGQENHINFWGTSFVCDPMGKILGKASADKEETLIVECDLSRIEEVRKDWPFLREC